MTGHEEEVLEALLQQLQGLGDLLEVLKATKKRNPTQKPLVMFACVSFVRRKGTHGNPVDERAEVGS